MPDVMQNRDAEQAVLSAMLMEPAAATLALRQLRAPMFALEAHQRLFAAMAALFARAEVIDPLTLSAELERAGDLERVGGKDYVGFLMDAVPTAANVEYHAGLVIACWQRRELARLAKTLAQQAAEPALVPDQVLANTSTALLGLSGSNGRIEGFVKAEADVAELARELAAPPPADGIVGVPTGWRDIDRWTGGALPGELWFFCAVPGGCKTLSLVNVATHNAVRRGVPTAFVSAEMTRKALLTRMLCDLAEIDTQTMRKRTFTSQQGERLAAKIAQLRLAPLYIDGTPAPTIRDVLARVEALKTQVPGVRLVCVDYVQLISGSSEENRAEEIRYVAKELKRLAKHLAVPVFSAAQVNDKDVERGRKSTRPTLADIQGSSGIRQAADVVVLQHRPRMYGEDDGTADLMTMILGKVRELGVAEIKLQCQLPYQRLVDYVPAGYGASLRAVAV